MTFTLALRHNSLDLLDPILCNLLALGYTFVLELLSLGNGLFLDLLPFRLRGVLDLINDSVLGLVGFGLSVGLGAIYLLLSFCHCVVLRLLELVLHIGKFL